MTVFMTVAHIYNDNRAYTYQVRKLIMWMRLRHHIEVSFVSSEGRRTDLLETEKRDEAQSSGLYAYPLEQVKVVYPSRERRVSLLRED